jgi:secondary thiamine-phosphate synthase enzyme
MMARVGRAVVPRGMRQAQQTVGIATQGPGLYEITEPLLRFVGEAKIGTGIVTAFCRHTSCSLLLQENADPDVKTDLLGFFRRLAPDGMDWIVHDTEGPDDMPAHIKAALTQSSVSIPVSGGVPMLGTWQGLYLFEHRVRPHRRQVVLHLVGE